MSETAVPSPSPAAGPRISRQRLLLGAAALVVIAAVVIVIVLVTGGGSNSPSGFSTANPGASNKVASANNKVLQQISTYNATVAACRSKSPSVRCVEAADRKLGDAIHVYANYVGSLHQTGAAGRVVANALNNAQVSANTFEILGDAEPTQQNYDTVLHNVNLEHQLSLLETAVNNLAGVLGR